jgi:hypothetical protein
MARNKSRNAFQARGQKFETLGLIVTVILIIALIIARSWHHISWSAR